MYEFTLHRPGISGFNRKTGEPLGHEPEITLFEARSNAEARALAVEMYRKTGLGPLGHYNISRAS